MSIAKVCGSVSVAVLGLLLACSAHAELKLATVNFQRLLEESNQAKAATKALQDEFAPRQRELQQRQKDLQAKQEKLNRDGAVMAEKERSTLEKDLAKGQRDLQSDGEAFSEEVNGRRNEELGKLQGFVVGEIQGYAKANGYDLIVPSSVVVFGKDSLDITPQVLTYLQSRPMTSTTPAAAPAAGKPTK